MSFLKDLLAMREQPIVEAKDDFDLDQAWDAFTEENKIYSFEGKRGVDNIMKIASQLFGYDTLEELLEDNSGILEHIHDFLREALEYDDAAQERLQDLTAALIAHDEDEVDENDDDIQEVIQTMARELDVPTGAIRAVLIGGDHPKMAGALDAMIDDGFEQGEGWDPNAGWFQSYGITKAQYDKLVQASQ